MLIQLAVQDNLIIHQMDVKSAYLNSDIDCELYIQQPEGFVKTDINGNDLVCKLQKSLYGLKQSARNWHNVLNTFLLGLSFQQSFADPCLYTKCDGISNVILIVWVDDLLIAASNSEILQFVKNVYLTDLK